MNARIVAIAFAALVFALPLSARADTPVMFYNAAGAPVSFNLTCDEGNASWHQYTIDAYAKRWFQGNCSRYAVVLSLNGQTSKTEHLVTGPYVIVNTNSVGVWAHPAGEMLAFTNTGGNSPARITLTCGSLASTVLNVPAHGRSWMYLGRGCRPYTMSIADPAGAAPYTQQAAAGRQFSMDWKGDGWIVNSAPIEDSDAPAVDLPGN